MRKHDVRKWLHAILDLLPVIIIPVFMVYSHRHTIDTYAITTPKYDTIHMQQNIVNGKPNSDLNDISLDGLGSLSYSDNSLCYETEHAEDFVITYKSNLVCNAYDKLYYSFDCWVDEHTTEIEFDFTDDLNVYVTPTTVKTHYSGIQETSPFSLIDLLIYNSHAFGYDFNLYIQNVQLFNLTQMFGSGNEPSIEEFNVLFPDEYYPVDSTASALYQNGTQTYNDTDIGSQFFYCLYNSVDKYFNMGNVFNLNGVYRWFEINIFHAQAPLSLYIVWNIVLYEFVMDLLFLLYGLFMWFIDMIEKLMEKPINSVR